MPNAYQIKSNKNSNIQIWIFKSNSNKPWGGKNKIVKYIRTTRLNYFESNELIKV